MLGLSHLRAFTFLVALGVLTTLPASADEVSVRALLDDAVDSPEARQIEILAGLADTGEPFVDTALTAWRRGEIYLVEQGGSTVAVMLENADSKEPTPAFLLRDGSPLTDGSGNPLSLLPKALESAPTTPDLRKQMKSTTDLVTLSHPDPGTRAAAAIKLGLMQRPEYHAILKKRFDAEADHATKLEVEEALAISTLANGTRDERVAAAKRLGEFRSIPSIDFLTSILSTQENLPEGERDADLIAAAKKSLAELENYTGWVDTFGTFFRGISLGSVLLIVSLGLAITFGLMGVINMAHGELIAVGGYSAYLTEKWMVAGFGPSALQWYFIVAIPVSFFFAAMVGLAMERGVIRFLYRRPLESLLATWGISLVLEQLFRLYFGAANVQVNSPDWMLGSAVVSDVSLGYNRIFVVIFAVLIVVGTWLLMNRTSLGLCIRAVMQNRDMASCMGIRASRIRMATFAFGSGLAGLAGCFLSQIGNVGPTMGQNYVVDSFMVVVSGGVGNMMGTVYASLGIGMTDQMLQPSLGPVMGKVCVLLFIILFLQWRPGGLFPAKSRSLD